MCIPSVRVSALSGINEGMVLIGEVGETSERFACTAESLIMLSDPLRFIVFDVDCVSVVLWWKFSAFLAKTI